MKHTHRSILVGVVARAATTAFTGTAAATDLEEAMAKPSNWASQAGDYANHR